MAELPEPKIEPYQPEDEAPPGDPEHDCTGEGEKDDDDG